MTKRKMDIRTNNDLRKHYTVNERSSNTFLTTTEVEFRWTVYCVLFQSLFYT